MPPINYWQGRKHELAEIQEWLSQPSTVLVGITGLGGFGKSTLAAKLLDKSTASRKFWADVRTGTDFSSLARRVLAAWGMAAEQVQAIPELNLSDVLVQQLQEQPGLLVIDNVESLLNQAGEWQNPLYQQFLQQWIQFGAQSKLLLTSRERPVLEARRTRWYALVNGLSAAEGAALLRDLGIRGETAELEVLVNQVGGYPLSLMLVAGLLLVEEEPDPQVRYLSHYGNLFQIRGLHRGENQTSIEQVFGWSFDRLSPELQHLLAKISVFRRAFNVTAAGALIPDIEITEADLRQLVRRSLLQELPRDKTDQRQFQFQPQVQELVQQRTDDLTSAHQRAIEYYRAVSQPKPWQELDDVAEYLEICYHHCELGQFEQAYSAVEPWYQLLYQWGQYTTVIEVYKRLVEEWQSANRGGKDSIGWAYMRLGTAYHFLGESKAELEAYQQAQKVFEEITGSNPNDPFIFSGLTASLDALGGTYCFLGQYSQSIKFRQQALETIKSHHSQHIFLSNKCLVLLNMGGTYREWEKELEAIECYQQALDIAQLIGDSKQKVSALQELGLSYCALKEYPRAIKILRKSLKLARQQNEIQKVTRTLNNLGFAYNLIGRHQRALKFHGYCLKVVEQAGNCREEARALKNIAETHCFLGNHLKAKELQQQALDIVRETGDRKSEATFLDYLGRSHNYLGEHEEARECYQNASNIAQQIGYRRGEADFLLNLGDFLQNLNRKSEAGKAYQQARKLYISMELITKVQACDDRLQQLETGSS